MTRFRIVVASLLATLVVAAPAEAASVKGTWKGTVHSGSISFAVKVTIKRTKVGSKAGTLSNPGSPCHGTLRVTSRRTGAWRATAPSGQVGTATLRRA